MHEYKFDTVKDKVTLDIGCGSGWVVKKAAMAGAYSIGVDFTEKAAISTNEALRKNGLAGIAIQADAQYLPIKSNSIDRVFSFGVLHHIPDTQKGIDEAFRITRKGGTAYISLYGKLFFFNRLLFPFAQFVLRQLLKAPKVRDGIQHTTDYDTFYKCMDGPTNPIGRWYIKEELEKMLGNFEIISMSKSGFPMRYLMIGNFRIDRIIPSFMRCWIEKLGMLRNFQLEKR